MNSIRIENIGKRHFQFIKRTLFLAVLLSFFSFSKGNELDVPTIDMVGRNALPDIIVPIKDAPFEIIQFSKPTFRNVTYDISKYGAKSGKKITKTINQLISNLSKKGGGTILIPKGKWISGRIELKSNINLHISEGAELHFSDDIKDYLPAVFTRHEGIEIMGPGAFIYANGQKNIAVTGKGTIFGPALDSPMRKLAIVDVVIENVVSADDPVEKRIYDGIDGRRLYVPKSISPINCTNVLIEGVKLEQSIFWNICPIYCENVIIRGVEVNSVGIPSGDGIDIESCRNVLVEYCTLSNGDDCFTLKSGRAEDGLRVGRATENVVIRNSLAKRGHGGFTCGSETAGGIKNVYVYECVFEDVQRGIRFKTRRNRGGSIENITCNRIRTVKATEAINWDLLGSSRYVGKLANRFPILEITPLTPVVRGFHFKDFIVESSKSFIRANCIPEIPLTNVLIENGNVKCDEIIHTLDDANDFVLRDIDFTTKNSALKMSKTENVRFENVNISVL